MRTREEDRVRKARYRMENRAKLRAECKQYRRDNKVRIARSMAEYKRKHPCLVAWQHQKSHAKCRGIGFLLTIEEFITFWGDSFEHRGRGPDDLCMGRYGDEGPYRLGNIYIVSMSENKEGPRPLPVPDF